MNRRLINTIVYKSTNNSIIEIKKDKVRYLPNVNRIVVKYICYYTSTHNSIIEMLS